jgi:isoaspartyl peptidase/L-asparaginase-like protein (Ntn-hydrolase superfamily)
MLIAVHVGAGWHAPAKEAAYKQLLVEAVAAARAAAARGGAPLDAVAAALRVLEVRPAALRQAPPTPPLAVSTGLYIACVPLC